MPNSNLRARYRTQWNANPQNEQRVEAGRTIGAVAAQEKACANAGMLDSGAFVRKRAGAWPSSRRLSRAKSGRSAVHYCCAWAMKNRCAGV
jgi:hypothetical protein